MPLKIPIAHDFICPWCWVGFFQAKRLQREFGAEIEWLGYELLPEELAWPGPPPFPEVKTNRPSTPTRLELLLAAEGMTVPPIERPKEMRTHNAHEAVEYAKAEGVADELVDSLYHAYWERGERINDLDVLARLATGVVSDVSAMLEAIRMRAFAGKVTGFDADAYASGVYNVPTFFIGGGRYAEQPWDVLERAATAEAGHDPALGIYANIDLPPAPDARPYVYVNMVVTIDGKSTSGDRGDSVLDLGSHVDHLLMDRLERAADAVMIGGQTARVSSKAWNPKSPVRIVVSESGQVPMDSAFMQGGASYVASGVKATYTAPHGIGHLAFGDGKLDLHALLRYLRADLGIERLHVLGGSELNASLLELNLVDELFATIAPKVKLGHDTPTYAGGNALSKDGLLAFDLVEHHVVGDEVFLRYRRCSHE